LAKKFCCPLPLELALHGLLIIVMNYHHVQPSSEPSQILYISHLKWFELPVSKVTLYNAQEAESGYWSKLNDETKPIGV